MSTPWLGASTYRTRERPLGACFHSIKGLGVPSPTLDLFSGGASNICWKVMLGLTIMGANLCSRSGRIHFLGNGFLIAHIVHGGAILYIFDGYLRLLLIVGAVKGSTRLFRINGDGLWCWSALLQNARQVWIQSRDTNGGHVECQWCMGSKCQHTFATVNYRCTFSPIISALFLLSRW